MNDNVIATEKFKVIFKDGTESIYELELCESGASQYGNGILLHLVIDGHRDKSGYDMRYEKEYDLLKDFYDFSYKWLIKYFETDNVKIERINNSTERLKILLENSIDYIYEILAGHYSNEEFEELIYHELGTDYEELKELGVNLDDF